MSASEQPALASGAASHPLLDPALGYSWYPGCLWHGSGALYFTGEIGRRGEGVTDADLAKPVHNARIPSSLSVTIDTPSATLYEQVSRALETIQCGALKIEARPGRSCIKLRLKPEYAEEVARLREANAKIEAQVADLCNQLEALGCDVDRVGPPSLARIPDHFLEGEDGIEYKSAGFNVCCHSGTPFYKLLLDAGVLERVYPAWYRDGQY